jgi:LytS/YehU family sensor histidine kinase
MTYRVYDLQAYLGFTKSLVYVGHTLFFTIIASYIHYFFVLPGLLSSKKILPYVFRITLLLLVIVTARILAENQVMPRVLANEEYYKTVKLTRVISTVWDTMTFLIFTGMIRFTVDWFAFENRKKQLENEKLIAELNYLKAQINPHFLFNTLHNLNYLVYSKSDRATEVVIKLSNIMRYMIYDANKERVPLQKEISYIHDYIDLERIRLNHPFRINVNVTGDISSVEIAPLIMLTFIENAFKHGVSDKHPDCVIDVILNVVGSDIIYHVTNRKLKSTEPSKLKSGFGLKNVMQRLELSYPDKHKLVIDDTAEQYSITLTLTYT